jgi:hypothetical protein
MLDLQKPRHISTLPRPAVPSSLEARREYPDKLTTLCIAQVGSLGAIPDVRSSGFDGRATRATGEAGTSSCWQAGFCLSSTPARPFKRAVQASSARQPVRRR